MPDLFFINLLEIFVIWNNYLDAWSLLETISFTMDEYFERQNFYGLLPCTKSFKIAHLIG